MKKLIFSLLLLSCIYAQTAVAPASGDGSEANPYQIATLENLYWIASDTLNWDKHYKQTTNINASNVVDWFGGKGWLPIAYEPGEYFSGSYNAQGYGISNLYINRPDKSEIGLFGSLYGANILNLFLTDLIIIGRDWIGGIAGSAYSSNITNCHTDGIIQAVYDKNYTSGNIGGLIGIGSGIIDSCTSMANVTGDHPVGGIIGLLSFSSLVKNCVFMGTVNASGSGGIAGGNYSKISQCVNKGKINGSGGIAGGISGGCSVAMDEINPRLLIDRCYNEGEVWGKERVGGVVGHAYNAIISDCYNIGKVSGDKKTGGLVGYIQSYVEIRDSYNAGNVSDGNGGLIGHQSLPGSIEIMNCFWDIDSSGQSLSDGGSGMNTNEMKNDTTYISNGWDFDEIWTINDTINNGYPSFLWSEQLYTPVQKRVPESFKLYQNYPNPFNPSTTIRYQLLADCNMKIMIFDLYGHKIKQWSNQYQPAGIYEFIWNGKDQSGGQVPSGVYIYSLIAGKFVESKKMVLLK